MTAAGSPEIRARALEEARAWIGTPYHHQASTRGAGCDCLGLVRGVYRALTGMDVQPPPYTANWAEDTGRETLLEAARRYLVEIPVAAAQPGDVLLFRWRAHLPAKHAGILSAPGRMIHAYDGHAVLETAIPSAWRARIAGAFAFPEA